MEDYKIDIRLSEGPKAQTITMPIEPFTLIGATTRLGMLTAPMRARFGIEQRLNFYPAEDLELIVQRTADVMKVEIDDEGASEIARRARGTPRVANRLLRRVRDFAQVKGNGVDHEGDRRSRRCSCSTSTSSVSTTWTRAFSRRSSRSSTAVRSDLNTIGAAIGEDANTIEEVYEPFLVQHGFLQRTPRGRMATATAYRHFGFTPRSRAGRRRCSRTRGDDARQPNLRLRFRSSAGADRAAAARAARCVASHGHRSRDGRDLAPDVRRHRRARANRATCSS